MSTMSVETLWSTSNQPSFLTDLTRSWSEEPDPVFVYSGLSNFFDEPDGCDGLPYMAYWASFTDADININSFLSVDSMKMFR